MSKKLKIGIAGFGMIGPVHLRRIFDKSMDLAEIIAIADPDTNQTESNLEKTVEEITKFNPQLKRSEIMDNLELYDDYYDMLSDDLDVVHICLPHDIHLQAIEDALSAGKNVIVEKPLALNLKEAHEISQLQSSYNKKIALISQNRYNEEITWLMKQILETGLEPRSIEFSVDWFREQSYYNQNNGWRGKNKSALGGVLTNQTYHQLDLALWIMNYKGEDIKILDKINSINKDLHPDIEVFDTVEGTIKLPEGHIYYYGTTCNHEKLDLTKFKVNFNNGYVELINRNGKVSAKSDFFLVPETFDSNKEQYKTQLGRPSYGFGHGDNIRYSYEAFLRGNTPPISVEDGIRILKVTDEILK